MHRVPCSRGRLPGAFKVAMATMGYQDQSLNVQPRNPNWQQWLERVSSAPPPEGTARSCAVGAT